MYVCTECGYETIKWQGKCPSCGTWNTLKEFKEAKLANTNSKGEVKNLEELSTVMADKKENLIVTKSIELNTVLGGGIVTGGVILLSGEPGIGKSTITLELANLVEEKIIYVSGEETNYQIANRAKRLGITGKNMQLLAESCIENILETLSRNSCDILVIDSISVMHSNNITGVAGSVSQVKFISELLVAFAKQTGTAVFIIGHITKDGNLAGPKTLEHMVDTVLFFEGDKYDNLRILRTLKNRFGATSEIGLFSMTDKGLKDLKNPGLEFVNSKEETIGSSLSITIEGTRPLVIETESLTTYTKFGYPKRSSRGIVSSKLDLIIAVLGKYTQIKLDSYDVYSNIARGLKIDEPGIDLSIAVSIISSKLSKKIPKDAIFIGEISLTGKIKSPMRIEQRIKEAEKMGFKTVYTPKGKYSSKKIDIIQVEHIADFIQKLGL